MKTARSTTHRLMIRILEKMSAEPIPLPRLAEKLEMPESNLRRALNDMRELQLVIQIPLEREQKNRNALTHIKICHFGWKKTTILGSEKINTSGGIKC
jgi:RIO-like serine/threonine protein kinase